MNKKEFLRKMDYYLLAINDEERYRFVGYYEEMIEDYLENGLSEEEAIQKIGDPKQITKKILEENKEMSFKIIPSNSILKIIFLIALFPIWGSLLLTFYLILGVVPLVILSSGLATAVVACVSILGCPFVMFHYNIPAGIMQLGVGIICIGIVLLLYKTFIVIWAKILLLLKKINGKTVMILKGDKE